MSPFVSGLVTCGGSCLAAGARLDHEGRREGPRRGCRSDQGLQRGARVFSFAPQGLRARAWRSFQRARLHAPLGGACRRRRSGLAAEVQGFGGLPAGPQSARLALCSAEPLSGSAWVGTALLPGRHASAAGRREVVRALTALIRLRWCARDQVHAGAPSSAVHRVSLFCDIISMHVSELV